MILSTLIVCTVLPLIGFVYSCLNQGVSRSIVSHFWYFTLIWLVCFPIRATLISYNYIDLQVIRHWSDSELFWSVLLSFWFWCVTYCGFLSTGQKSYHSYDLSLKSSKNNSYKYKISWRAYLVLCLTIIMGILFYYNFVLIGGNYVGFIGNEQNEARVGGGHLFIFAELFILAAIAYWGRIIYFQRFWPSFPLEYLIYSAIFCLSIIMTVAINSRRIVATIFFSILIIYTLKHKKQWIVPLVAIGSTFLLAPVLQVIRYLQVAKLLDGSLTLTEAFSTIDSRFFLTNISSSFEGVDHLGVFIEKAGTFGLLLGIDGGISWLYNAGLALIPRIIWIDKPLIYGSVAQQYFLYPQMYEQGAATTTLPPSFVVDFLFGFGILGGLILCFIMGRFLGVLSQEIWNQFNSPAIKGISLFMFINTFNIVRSGSGLIQGLLIFLTIQGCVLGFQKTYCAIVVLLRRTFLFEITHSHQEKLISENH